MSKLKLIDGKRNVQYKIKSLELSNPNTTMLLNNLGINEDETIVLLQSNYGKKSYLVNVSGVSFALDKKVCEGIIVE